MTDVQRTVQQAIDDLVAVGPELGLQVAVYYQGALIVDAWSGVADRGTGRMVDGETLFTVFSTSKGITATVIHMLAARGLLGYDEPIATYWPEFAAHGKEQITLRHALTHTAAIPQLPDGVGEAELCDWHGMCRRIEDLTPLWTPGTRVAYHAFTYGWILGEVARRVDGRAFGRLVREEIAARVGIEGLYFGIPDAVETRCAMLEEPVLPAAAPPALDDFSREAVNLRAIPPHLAPLGPLFNKPLVRRACIPAGGAAMNARSIAGHYAALIGGSSGTEPLVSQAYLDAATALQREDVLDDGTIQGRWGLGYALGLPDAPVGPLSTSFGHDGYGGSVGFADPVNGLAFGLAKTWLETRAEPAGAETAVRIRQEVYSALGVA